MSAGRRALVECAVLSLQDSCVFYPSCKGCFSRIDSGSADTRLSCRKCGYSSASALPDYRYRLSVRVARGNCLFGVTVFGNCLNQFFGINASGLQRLLADKTGQLETSKCLLLKKAVEDCFIGKHFIFGVKVTGIDNEPFLGHSNGSNNMAQLIATQMILPKAAGLRGCTVLTYLEAIFPKSAEAQLSTTNASKNAKLQREPVWPIPHYSQTSGFTNDTLCGSDFLPLSLSRTPCLDSSLSPTPPWQQSLGLITSSAEQEEISQDVHESPLIIKKLMQSSTPLKTWLNFSPTAHKKCLTLHTMDYSTSDLTKPVLSECQEEFPLSESLTEFLKDKNTLESIAGVVKDEHYERKSRSTINNREFSEDDQSKSGVYNCSADLFSNSPGMDLSAEAFDNSLLESVCVLLPTSKGDISAQPPMNAPQTSKQTLSVKAENCSTPNNQKPEKDNKRLRESFQLRTSLDFIPASRSTPAEKGKCIQSNLRTKYVRKCKKENILKGGNQTALQYCVTPKSRCRKQMPDNLRFDELLNSIYKRRSSCFGNDKTERIMIVPPTPANPRKAPLNPQSKLSDCTVEGNEDSTAEEERDWSKDLFSDSV